MTLLEGAHRPQSAWSQETFETVSRLWKQGYSGGAIAGMMPGLTRCAVIGKMTRLGIQQGGTKTILTRIYEKPKPKPAPPATSQPAIPAPQEPPTGWPTLFELSRHQCRYPVHVDRDEGEYLFCGEVSDGESSYCAYHHGKCLVPPRPLKRRVRKV